jgi:hypothetical protein
MKIWILAAIAWAALISAAARSEPAAAWLAVGTIALAPLALAALAALARPRPGAIRAIDAEAVAWSQAAPPAPPRPKAKGLAAGPARAVRGPQPLSA